MSSSATGAITNESSQDYRDAPMVGDNSDVIRRKKEAQRHRRLEPGEEDKLLRSAEPHLQALIVAALETCGRQGELLTLRWGDVSLERGEIILRAEHTKNRENRILPISTRVPEGVGDEARQSRGGAIAAIRARVR
jgi:integrase